MGRQLIDYTREAGHSNGTSPRMTGKNGSNPDLDVLQVPNHLSGKLWTKGGLISVCRLNMVLKI